MHHSYCSLKNGLLLVLNWYSDSTFNLWDAEMSAEVRQVQRADGSGHFEKVDFA